MSLAVVLAKWAELVDLFPALGIAPSSTDDLLFALRHPTAIASMTSVALSRYRREESLALAEVDTGDSLQELVDNIATTARRADISAPSAECYVDPTTTEAAAALCKFFEDVREIMEGGAVFQASRVGPSKTPARPTAAPATTPGRLLLHPTGGTPRHPAPRSMGRPQPSKGASTAAMECVPPPSVTRHAGVARVRVQGDAGSEDEGDGSTAPTTLSYGASLMNSVASLFSPGAATATPRPGAARHASLAEAQLGPVCDVQGQVLVDIKAQNRALVDQAAGYYARLTAQESELSVVHTQLVTAHVAMEQERAALAQLNVEKGALEGEVGELCASLSLSEAAMETARVERVSAHEEWQAALQRLGEEKGREMEGLRQQFESAAATAATAYDSAAAQVTGLSAERDAERATVSAQAAVLEAAQAQCSDLSCRVEELTASCAEVQAALATALHARDEAVRAHDADAASAQAQVASISAALARVKRDLLATKDGCAFLAAEYASMSASLGAALVEGVRAAAAREAEANSRFAREQSERRRLWNRVSELRGNIRVLARVRPLLGKEGEEGSAVRVTGPYDLVVTETCGEGATGRVHGKVAQAHEFDRVFGPEDGQAAVWEEVQPMVTSALDGYHSTIFAYGQTGSGKTFTMEGPAGVGGHAAEEDLGVYARALRELFAIAGVKRADGWTHTIRATMVEIYNERVRDLLSPTTGGSALLPSTGAGGEDADMEGGAAHGGEGEGEPPSSSSGGAAVDPDNLSIRIGPTGNFLVGVTSVDVASPADVAALMAKGSAARSVGKTNMNEHSSRSHCLLQVSISGSYTSPEGKVESVSGKLTLVDLAGSERLDKSGAEGKAKKEAVAINTSLLSLGLVLKTLGQAAATPAGSTPPPVPYRNSTLTWLLKDSLGKEGKVAMIAQVAPVTSSRNETAATLNFAAQVKKVELGKAVKHSNTAGDAAAARAEAKREREAKEKAEEAAAGAEARERAAVAKLEGMASRIASLEAHLLSAAGSVSEGVAAARVDSAVRRAAEEAAQKSSAAVRKATLEVEEKARAEIAGLKKSLAAKEAALAAASAKHESDLETARRDVRMQVEREARRVKGSTGGAAPVMGTLPPSARSTAAAPRVPAPAPRRTTSSATLKPSLLQGGGSTLTLPVSSACTASQAPSSSLASSSGAEYGYASTASHGDVDGMVVEVGQQQREEGEEEEAEVEEEVQQYEELDTSLPFASLHASVLASSAAPHPTASASTAGPAADAPPAERHDADLEDAVLCSSVHTATPAEAAASKPSGGSLASVARSITASLGTMLGGLGSGLPSMTALQHVAAGEVVEEGRQEGVEASADEDAPMAYSGEAETVEAAAIAEAEVLASEACVASCASADASATEAGPVWGQSSAVGHCVAVDAVAACCTPVATPSSSTPSPSATPASSVTPLVTFGAPATAASSSDAAGSTPPAVEAKKAIRKTPGKAPASKVAAAVKHAVKAVLPAGGAKRPLAAPTRPSSAAVAHTDSRKAVGVSGKSAPFVATKRPAVVVTEEGEGEGEEAGGPGALSASVLPRERARLAGLPSPKPVGILVKRVRAMQSTTPSQGGGSDGTHAANDATGEAAAKKARKRGARVAILAPGDDAATTASAVEGRSTDGSIPAVEGGGAAVGTEEVEAPLLATEPAPCAPTSLLAASPAFPTGLDGFVPPPSHTTGPFAGALPHPLLHPSSSYMYTFPGMGLPGGGGASSYAPFTSVADVSAQLAAASVALGVGGMAPRGMVGFPPDTSAGMLLGTKRPGVPLVPAPSQGGAGAMKRPKAAASSSGPARVRVDENAAPAAKAAGAAAAVGASLAARPTTKVPLGPSRK